jgi:hypothetical protein
LTSYCSVSCSASKKVTVSTVSVPASYLDYRCIAITAIFAGGERRTEEKESSSLHHTEESDSEGELHIDMDSGPFHPILLFYRGAVYKYFSLQTDSNS